MKRLVSFVLCLSCVFGCTPENGGGTASVDLASNQKDVVEIVPEGGIENVRFSSALNWTVEISDSWLKATPSEGQASSNARFAVSATKNDTYASRTAVVNICSGSVKVPVTIVQEPVLPKLDLLPESKSVSAKGGTFVIKVSAEVDYECECDATWITEISGKAVTDSEHYFTVEPNPSSERSTVITFKAEKFSKIFNVTQRAAGTEADDWKYDDFKHRSLAMRFTADWCGFCPMMAEAFGYVKEELGDAVEIISVHGGGSALDFEDANALLQRFKVEVFPSGCIDARALISNTNNTSVTASNAVAVARETDAYYATKTGIAINSSLAGSELTVDLSVYVKEADTYKVAVIVLEDNIKAYQYGVIDSYNYIHNDIARIAVTSSLGETVRVGEDNTIWQKSYTVTVPDEYNKSNLRILVYVEKPYGDQERVEGVNSKNVEYGNYGNTYVDNCRSVAVGADAGLELE